MSAYESNSHVIDGVTYDITKLGTLVANRVLIKLSKSVAPALFIMATTGRRIDPSALAGAAQSLSEDDFEWVCLKFAEKTTVHLSDGRAPSLGGQNGAIFDQHFSGRTGQLFQWLECCVEDNFGPFFVELKAKAEAARKAAEAAASNSSSPAT